MKRSTGFRIWNALFWALLLLPLAIFLTGRGSVFDSDDSGGDPHLARHLGASALYVVAVALFMAWLRVRRGRAVVVGVLAASALAGAAVVFVGIGGTAVREAGVEGVAVDVAVAIIVYLSAVLAAWVLAWSILMAVRRRRNH